eukprot:CAMPEP_0198235742 /NCGR_PEP_ID=MMETSP1446-20131203/1646_1 /TAXON_ID=1461542 ORGANISM="Unidentified sp, Strain CCMP2111" /NCGR_SAMPLE_ID=MMETSP1446 /ASSEMBLY_ACC=CAM_ASM_001112 /LENGTH=219 /DNA_ID=CAMNT_0043917101 /DNA_START=34 /DNA_END=693 /DNA_ORIENTATION=+
MAHQAIMQQALENKLLEAASAIEQSIDDEMHRLETLDEDDLDKLRERRLAALKKQQAKRKEWLRRGHGELRDVEEKEFFNEMRNEERVIAHFYRNNWPCKVMDKHLNILAAKHVETKFVRVDAEKCPFLTDKLKIWMLPTLALIKSEKVIDYVVGFDDLGGVDDFETSTLAMRLSAGGFIFEDDNSRKPQQSNIRKTVRTATDHSVYKRTESDEDSDFD